MITQQELQERLNYNPDTGAFTWKVSTTNSVKVGDIAGSKHNQGYKVIRIKDKLYKAHRLAWFYIYGFWPKNEIDHINGIKDDNRIENLRDISRRENESNKQLHRDGHLAGTTFHKKTKKWQSQIEYNGKRKYLGLFETKELAHQEYLNFIKANNL